VDGNCLLHQNGLDLPLAIDFELAQLALAADAGLVEATIGRDAGALDLFARGNLGFLERLDTGDLELFDGTSAFDPRRLQRMLARDIRGLDLPARDNLGLPDLAVGVDALGLLGRKRNDAVLVRDLDRLLVLDVEDFALLGGRDPLGFEREIDADALALDGVAMLQLGSLEHGGALDLERARVTLGLNTLGCNGLLLRNPGGFDGFA
jgi:hypothetical protein